MKGHWEKVYDKQEVSKLGWYEEHPDPSLNLIEQCRLDRAAHILHVGAGATTLVDVLLQKGFSNMVVNDISSSALDKLRKRLGPELSPKVRWMEDDLTQSASLDTLEPLDLWHDRAVLHFFNQKEEQEAYFNLLRKLVKVNGFVIIAAFNLEGAEQCSGLPVFRYDEDMLQEQLGTGFSLLQAFDYTYQTPSGNPRAYVYTLFQRKSV